MTKVSNVHIQAQQLLEDCGLDEITNIEIGLLVAWLDAILIEEELTNCDGKIIPGKNKVIIKVRSSIQFEQRKRFVIAHEIGHLILHRNIQLHDDIFSNFNIFEGMENALKNGKQELEANEFASELLMPQKLFLQEAKGEKFSPLLIKNLSERFKTSLTATVFRYLRFDELHPICLIFIENGKVRYWKKSNDLKVWINDYIGLPPPSDSVAEEYIQSNYDFVYKFEDKTQVINKSTWFNLGAYDEDSIFYEYCIPTKKYKTILSIIWED